MAMHVRVVAVIGVLLALLLGLPHPASAQEITITGVVVRVDASQDRFWLQEYGSGSAGRIWAVQVTDFSIPGLQPALRLQAGEVVEVRGWVTGTNQLLAREIEVRSGGVGIGTGPTIVPPGRRIEIDGIIIAMDPYRRGLLQVQDRFRGQARVWTVRVTPRTRIEGQRGGRRWDDDGTGIGAAQRLLEVGDLIEVEGRLIASDQILAEEIKVRGQARIIPRPGPYPQPVPYPIPPYGPTVILAPRAGTEVSGSEFTVVGRTAPRAHVQVHVMMRWGIFQIQVTNNTVYADQYGFFALVVRPTTRIPGATYTITATSTFQGVSMTPVSVTVRQL
jgi:hypothetical protein